MIIRRIARAGRSAALTLSCMLMILCSQGSREGAARGAEICLGVLVPSLFPFMALTGLLVKSGFCTAAGRALRLPSRILFGTCGALAPVIVLSLLGGYPVGAGGIAALHKQGAVTESEARRAALFAVCAGPGFTVSFIGGSVYGSTATGLILFAAQVISVLLTGAGTRIFLLRREEEIPSPAKQPCPSPPFAQAFTGAVEEAARGMLRICAFVVLFSSITGILSQLFPEGTPLTAAFVLLEVCGAVTRCAGVYPAAVTAFAAGFGGLCVHCQIFASLGSVGVNKPLFFLFRIIQGLLTAVLTHLGLQLLPQKAMVFSTASAGVPSLTGGSVLAGAVLLCVLICFCVTLRQTTKRD